MYTKTTKYHSHHCSFKYVIRNSLFKIKLVINYHVWFKIRCMQRVICDGRSSSVVWHKNVLEWKNKNKKSVIYWLESRSSSSSKKKIGEGGGWWDHGTCTLEWKSWMEMQREIIMMPHFACVRPSHFTSIATIFFPLIYIFNLRFHFGSFILYKPFFTFYTTYLPSSGRHNFASSVSMSIVKNLNVHSWEIGYLHTCSITEN